MQPSKLIRFYEKAIYHGAKNQTDTLFNKRGKVTCLQELSKEEIASERFSKEFLELLIDEKTFKRTYNTLKLIYFKKVHNESRGTAKKRDYSEDFYRFMFEHIFSQRQKRVIDKMIIKQFGGQCEDFSQKEGNTNTKTSNQNQEKQEQHLFVDFLVQVFCEEDIKQKKKQHRRQSQSQQPSQSQFLSIRQILKSQKR